VGWIENALRGIERAGNRLPDPVTLFFVLIFVLMAVSVAASGLGVSAVNPATGETVTAQNLLSAEYIRRLFVEMPRTFASFPPLGMVLVTILGVGLAERSGLIAASLAALVRRAPRPLLSATVVFGGIMSSLAADAGYVVLIPLGGVVFAAAGRHPVAGVAAAFAGVSAGFSANLLLTSLDPLLAGITETSAQIIDADYRVPITANYYLMAGLVPAFTLVGALATDLLVEPRLGAYAGEVGADDIEPASAKGLIAAGATLAAIVAAVLAMTLPADGILRGEDGGLGPFYQSLVGLIAVGFALLGLAYGIAAGKIKSDRDAVQMSAASASDMGLYIVLAFAAAHFIALFAWSNLGVITAVAGANALQAVGFTGLPLMVAFVFVSAFLNLFIGSASAKWAIMSTIFVPLMMLLGISPEAAQAGFRIGDSVTNVLTPLMPYFPLVIVFAKRYLPEFGIGDLLAAMLPYSLGFLIVGVAMLIVWFVFGLPLGPGAGFAMPSAP